MLNARRINTVIASIAVLLAWSSATQAGSIVQCGQALCPVEFSIFIDGSNEEAGGGQFLYNAKTGNIQLDTQNNIRGGGMHRGSGLMWNLGGGAQVSVNNLFGNADPILGFALGATTGANSQSFAFAFDLPIQVRGTVEAQSSVSYSLTSLSAAGAQITPTTGDKVVNAADIDNTIGGELPLQKGVNVGERFFFTGGPQTENSPVYTASNIITGDYAYDMMAVNVAFALSAQSSVGVSGFVAQNEVPVPAAFLLFASALTGLGTVARFKKAA